MKNKKDYLVFAFLTVLGCGQMAGDVTNAAVVKAVFLATNASPAPKVFTAHQGFETYSSQFFLSWKAKNGKTIRFQITPQLYRMVYGPYNRRNAYGAAVSYSPVLYANPMTHSMFENAAKYAFCKPGQVLRDLGYEGGELPANAVTLELIPQQKLPQGHPWKLKFEVACDAK